MNDNIDIKYGKMYQFDYTNHAGHNRIYTAQFTRLYFGTARYYSEPAMLIEAVVFVAEAVTGGYRNTDIKKRTFQLGGIRHLSEVHIPE